MKSRWALKRVATILAWSRKGKEPWKRVRGEGRKEARRDEEGRRVEDGADLIVHDSSYGFRFGEVGFEMFLVPVVESLDCWGVFGSGYWS